MFLVADAAGSIGRAVTEQLVGQGQLVRILTTDATCRDFWRSRGVEVNEGDPQHGASWVKALEAIETLILILPPFISDESRLRGAESYQEALLEAIPTVSENIKVVFLSAMGAEKNIGWAKSLGSLEGKLKEASSNLTIIRSAYLMENLAAGIAMAKHHSVLPSFLSEGQNYALVGRKDLVSILVSAALDPISGQHLMELHGPESYSLDDIVEAGRNVLMKHIASLSLPESDWTKIMKDQGLDASAAESWKQYYQAMNSGEISSDAAATPLAGETSLSDALFQVWKAIRQNERDAIDPEKKIYEGLE